MSLRCTKQGVVVRIHIYAFLYLTSLYIFDKDVYKMPYILKPIKWKTHSKYFRKIGSLF